MRSRHGCEMQRAPEGARGPDGEPWPIPYLVPFSPTPRLVWSGQWALNAWPNVLLTAALIALALPVLCATAFDDLRRRIASPGVARLVTGAVLLAAAIDGVAFDWYCFRGAFDMPLQLAPTGTPFTVQS